MESQVDAVPLSITSFTQISLSKDSNLNYDTAGSSISVSSNFGHSLTNSTQSSRVPVHTYGATALSASGKESNVVLSEIDSFPVDMVCPNCRQAIETSVKYKPGKVTFLTSGLIGVLTCGLGCCLIPFLLKPLKDAYHYCPRCGSTVGVYKRRVNCCT